MLTTVLFALATEAAAAPPPPPPSGGDAGLPLWVVVILPVIVPAVLVVACCFFRPQLRDGFRACLPLLLCPRILGRWKRNQAPATEPTAAAPVAYPPFVMLAP